VKDRVLRIAFGCERASRLPKRAARSDEGSRSVWWRMKPSRPREKAGMM
jgi:hypothetical protein